MHMLMDPETSEMQISLFTDFESATDLRDMFKAMNNFSNMKGQGGVQANDKNNPFSSFADNGSTEMQYEFDKKELSAQLAVTDYSSTPMKILSKRMLPLILAIPVDPYLTVVAN